MFPPRFVIANTSLSRASLRLVQRTWATGSEHDQQPLAWLSRIGKETELAHVHDALNAALAEDASIGECQTGLLAVECVAYLRGGDADLHPHAHAWLRTKRPTADDALRDLALAVIDKTRSASRLATWWHVELADKLDGWLAALDHVAARLRSATRVADAASPTSGELDALKADLDAALPHLRVALVPKLIDEPIASMVVAPGLSLLLYYALPNSAPVPVPQSHVDAWGRSVWKDAAARTRAVAELKIHIIESEHHEVSVVFGSDTFTAGMAPFVDIFLDAPAPHGVLLGIPFAGGFVFHRIVDNHWREAATDVIEHIERLFESEEPISKKLYWWRDGSITEQDYHRIGDALIINGTPELLEAMSAVG